MEQQAEGTNKQAEETVEQTTQETEVSETESQETESETAEATEVESKEQAQEETTEEQTEEEFVPWKLKVEGEEIEVKTKDELTALAQKGLHYTKKMQTFAEAEKARASEQQFNQSLQNNPKVFEMLVAQNLGTDPSLIFRTPMPPNESLKDYDPVGYGRDVARYENEVRQKQLIEQTVPLVIRGQVDATNNVVFQRGTIANELTDAQSSEVRQFVQNNLRPNQMGMYSDEQVKMAVSYLYGSQKAEKEKLKTSEKFNEKLKQLSKQSPGKTASQRSSKEKESTEAAYLKYVEESSDNK